MKGTKKASIHNFIAHLWLFLTAVGQQLGQLRKRSQNSFTMWSIVNFLAFTARG
jgi:hypothetical protein